MKYTGGCHCGAVQFEVEADEAVEVENCNCSICSMTGYLHLIVPQRSFKIVQGYDALSTYQFNEKIAQHQFCRICGVKPFYIPRSNPDGVDVNLRCLHQMPKEVKVTDFDGQNWEANADKLAYKSK